MNRSIYMMPEYLFFTLFTVVNLHLLEEWNCSNILVKIDTFRSTKFPSVLSSANCIVLHAVVECTKCARVKNSTTIIKYQDHGAIKNIRLITMLSQPLSADEIKNITTLLFSFHWILMVTWLGKCHIFFSERPD